MGRNSTGVGLAMASSASDSPAAARIYPICGDASLDAEPRTYEGEQQITPDLVHIKRAGETLSWKIPDISPTPHVFGYLANIFLGAIASAVDVHTIIPADASRYLKLFLDDGVDKGTSVPTETGLGGKIGEFSFEMSEGSFAKMEVGGQACTYGSPTAALAPSLETGDDAEPLSWAALQAAGGYVKVGYAGAALAEDGNITGFKINGSRQQKAVGFDVDNVQPTAINDGKREITFELMREFVGADDLAAYNAVKNGEAVALEINMVVGTSYVKISIPNAVVTGAFGGDVPAAIEEDPQRTLQCKAIQKDGVPIMTITVKDGVSGDYT